MTTYWTNGQAWVLVRCPCELDALPPLPLASVSARTAAKNPAGLVQRFSGDANGPALWDVVAVALDVHGGSARGTGSAAAGAGMLECRTACLVGAGGGQFASVAAGDACVAAAIQGTRTARIFGRVGGAVGR